MVLGRDIPKINGWNLKIHPIENGKSSEFWVSIPDNFQGVTRQFANLLGGWIRVFELANG